MATDRNLDWENSTMSLEEWNKYIDDWIARENAVEKPIKPLIWEGEGGMKIKGLARGLTNKLATQDLIRRYALSYGDLNPLYRDPDYAAETKWGGIIAPPLFIHCIAYPGVQLPAVPDGVGGVQFLDAGVDHEFYQVIRPGDTFYGTTQYQGITEKKSSNPKRRLLFTHTQCLYYNQRGEKVAKAIGKVVITAVAPGTKSMTGGMDPKSYKMPHYDDATLQKIYDHYEDELSYKNERGAVPRYWEDVKEGDELPPVLCGPLDESDMMSLVACQANIGYPGAFAHKYALTFADPLYCLISEETGARRAADFHVDREAAHQMGFPAPVHYGSQSMALLSHVITNWAGDDAFIRKLNFQCRKLLFFGDLNTNVGKITKKYEENGRHLVDIYLEAYNQNHVVHDICDATVELPSKN